MHRTAQIPTGLLLSILLLLVSPDILAEAPDEPLDPHRTEFGLIPFVAGNTDIGVMFGVTSVMARFKPDYDPFRWRHRLVAMMSLKRGPDRPEIVVYTFFLTGEYPDLRGGRLRLIPRVSFSRTITNGYYGIGNDSSADVLPDEAVIDAVTMRHNQYRANDAIADLQARIRLIDDLELVVAGRFLYTDTDPYLGSQLSYDAENAPGGVAPLGIEPHPGVLFELGLLYDTRDHEANPLCGMRHRLSGKLGPHPMIGGDYMFGGATLDLRFYYPLLGKYLVVAWRLIGDIIAGDAPFYELDNLGGIERIGFAGMTGIRGPPSGRFAGKRKAITNLELRSMFLPFNIGKHRFELGTALFFDTGRVWATLERNETLDGTGLGLKWGTGGGLRIKWGETLVVRMEVGWSPNTKDAPSNLPIGIYLDMSHAF